jgi:RNA polymerase sigma-70 factor (ECF subfamily)
MGSACGRQSRDVVASPSVARRSLVDAFRAPVEAGAATDASGLDDGALQAMLAAACASGRAAFPQLAVDEDAFAAYLGRVVRAGETAPSMLPELALDDLYLACACLTNVTGAAEVFGGRFGATIRGAVARIVGAADTDEVHQQLQKSLLVGNETTTPKLGSYAGKAPLERWVGVSARRAALMWLRDNRTEQNARAAAGAEPATGSANHPETAYMKEKYRGVFEDALSQALERLPEQERALLRLHLVNGVSLEKIGTMFSVSQPTASRWMAAARTKLLDDVKLTLAPRLGTSSAELASLAGMVASRIDLSLSTLLKVR